MTDKDSDLLEHLANAKDAKSLPWGLKANNGSFASFTAAQLLAKQLIQLSNALQEHESPDLIRIQGVTYGKIDNGEQWAI